jgi:hypothetical protein
MPVWRLEVEWISRLCPIHSGLKDVKPESDGPEYQVCVQRGSKLVVLGAYANKWLQSDTFKADAKTLIDAHNENYNADGDYVEEPERTASFKKTTGSKDLCRNSRILFI